MNKQNVIFVETQEHRRFEEFCDACRRDCYIGLCYGMAGVGKTFSARYYTHPKNVVPGAFPPLSAGKLEKGPPDRKVALYTPSVVNSPGQIGREIGRCRSSSSATLLNRLAREEKPKLAAIERDLEAKERAAYRSGVSTAAGRAAQFREETDAYFSEYKRYQSRRREIREIPMLLIIDEADRLRMASLEQVRAIFDQGGMGLVLIGMPGLEKRLARYAQLYSRVGFVHEFCALAETEVRGLLGQGWQPPGVTLPGDALTDEEALAAILRITDGNFRLLSRLLTQIARVLTINNLPRVTPAVVEVARESLVIGTA
jgi:DNA transposition AAA+ family ATPase